MLREQGSCSLPFKFLSSYSTSIRRKSLNKFIYMKYKPSQGNLHATLNSLECRKVICMVSTANKLFKDPIFLIKVGNALQ